VNDEIFQIMEALRLTTPTRKARIFSFIFVESGQDV